jgi:hypothetical protein
MQLHTATRSSCSSGRLEERQCSCEVGGADGCPGHHIKDRLLVVGEQIVHVREPSQQAHSLEQRKQLIWLQPVYIVDDNENRLLQLLQRSRDLRHLCVDCRPCGTAKMRSCQLPPGAAHDRDQGHKRRDVSAVFP